MGWLVVRQAGISTYFSRPAGSFPSASFSSGETTTEGLFANKAGTPNEFVDPKRKEDPMELLTPKVVAAPN